MKDYKTSRCIGCFWWDDKIGCFCQEWNLRWQCPALMETEQRIIEGRTFFMG
nr:MAG TPA: hypothetical protein [Caudoviricetes sp.]